MTAPVKAVDTPTPAARRLLRRRRQIAGVVLLVLLLVVAWGTLGPPPRAQVRGAARWLHDVARFLTGEPEPARPDRSLNFGPLSAQDLGNLVLFLPFGFLWPVRFVRWRWWTVPAGAALSALIEIVQLTVATHRSPEIEDWVWNSVGTVAGFGLWLAVRHFWRRRTVWGSAQTTR